MERIRWIILPVLISGLGCTRAVKKETSVVRIDTKKISKTNGALGAAPAGYKICYGVNVTAADIAAAPRSCGAPLGRFAGFVESGAELAVEVPPGSGRTVDVYAFLTADTSAACPVFKVECQASLNCSTYKVASQPNVDIAGESQ